MHEQTKQSYLMGIAKALIYIDEHLEKEISLEKVAFAAAFSPYHFHRVFKAFTGATLGEYVRRLRIERAAGKIRYSKQSITDIALDSGYQTPSAFTKAFQQVMGKAPREFRSKVENTAKRIQKDFQMIKATIETMEDLPVLFVRAVGSYESSPNQAWTALMQFVKEKYPELEGGRKFGLALDNPEITEEKNLRFDACISANGVQGEGEVGLKTIAGGSFATFIHEGRYETLEKTFDRIFSEWYPAHKDQVADKPCFCEYLSHELLFTNPDALRTKIYIPLS